MLPVLDYRASRWPPQRQIAMEVDTLQRKMAAACLRAPRHPAEALDVYHRRRAREAATHCRHHGVWSKRWFARSVAWDDHLRRQRNAESWPAKLLHHHDFRWLANCRLNASSSSVRAGRTNTRLAPGVVQVRWDSGVQYARESLR